MPPSIPYDPSLVMGQLIAHGPKKVEEASDKDVQQTENEENKSDSEQEKPNNQQ
ncbi:hypothetical protein TrVGV298_001157 [Trichoderma virens]|nr:hypothetical protein TrVGV298_001157 [Trichoderma virens]